MSKNDKQKREQERLEKKAAETLPLGGAARALLDANGFDTSKNPTPEQAKAQSLGAQAVQGVHAAIAAMTPEQLEKDMKATEARDAREVADTMEALIEERDRLKVRVSTLEAAAGNPAMPADGWSSPCAKELVEKVPPSERELLLGDLLADLALLAGETGKNESAQDVLARRVHEAAKLRQELEDLQKKYDVLAQHHRAEREHVLELQAAMVAKRSPSAGAEMVLMQVGELVHNAAMELGSDPNTPIQIVPVVERVVNEWSGLRELLGAKPLTAVAVRDDSTPALAERYALMVLRWDGAKLDFEMVDGPARPWVDLARPMRHAVDTKLVPSTFR